MNQSACRIDVIALDKAKMKYYFDAVGKELDVIIVPSNNIDDAIVNMSIKEYNSLGETGFLQSTSANRKGLEDSIK